MYASVHLKLHLKININIEIIKLFSAATARNLVDDSKLWKNMQHFCCWILSVCNQVTIVFSRVFEKHALYSCVRLAKMHLFKTINTYLFFFFTWTFALFVPCQRRAPWWHNSDGFETDLRHSLQLWDYFERKLVEYFFWTCSKLKQQDCDTNENWEPCNNCKLICILIIAFLLVNCGPVSYNL